MKKKVLTFTLSLAMALSLSACGGKPVSKDSTPFSNRESNQEASDEKESGQDSLKKESSSLKNDDESVPSDSSSPESGSAESSSALAQWYEGPDRAALESYVNSSYNDSGLNFYITIEEPGTIIYNYQYTEQMDFSSFGPDGVENYFVTELDKGADAIVADIANFQTSYDMPLTTIRMTYLNADGSLVYSQDFTEDYESPSLSEDTSIAKRLAEWVESEDAQYITEQTNQQLEASGVRMSFTSDGNVLCWDYYYSDEYDFEGISQEDMDATLKPAIESQIPTVKSMFDLFESEYDLTLDAIRLSIYTDDGKLLYFEDVANE